MIALTLGIIFTSFLIISFKYFEKYNIDSTLAIVINYFSASLLSYFFSSPQALTSLFHPDWFLFSIVLGILFISVFRLIDQTTVKAGVSVASVANKMSVIIPVFAAVYFYNDHLSFLKITGILIALIAIYLSSRKNETKSQKVDGKKIFLLSLLVFIGSGIIDTMINYAQKRLISSGETEIFLTISFFSAGVTGLALYLFKLHKTQTNKSYKPVLAGICLGIINYFSIHFLIQALNSSLESSVVIPVNNIGVVAFSTLFSFFVFKENLSKTNRIGIFLAIIATLLIAFS
jgi:drug/metabolite transporter (DMT)-like permease